MARYRVARKNEDTSLPPGVYHRYVHYVAKTKGMKFTPTEGSPKTWTHVAYRTNELFCRERLDQVDVDIRMTLHEAEGHKITQSHMPDVVQMYEVYEGV